MLRGLFPITLLSASIACRPLASEVLRVGPGEAFADIQAAVDAAADGDRVVVASGEYVVTAPIDFNRVQVPGDPEKNIALESEGGAAVTTIRMADDPEDPSQASVVVFQNWEGSGSILQGFTIAGGKGFEYDDEVWGGGLICIHSRPTVKDCRITGNSGDGVAILGESRPSLTSCTIWGNAGAGIYVEGDSSLSLVHCTIAGNSGGGVYCGEEGAIVYCRSSIVWGSTGGSFIWSPYDEELPHLFIDYSAVERLHVDPGDSNTNTDPLFSGWTSGEVWVDPSAAPGGDGSQERPFSDVRDAFTGFSLALSKDSPCLGTGEGGTDMGSDAGRSDAPPSLTRTVRLAPGTYRSADLDLVNRVSLQGAGADRTVIEGTIGGLRTDALLAGVAVTGGTLGGIFVAQFTSPEIRDCAIVGNGSHWGAGITCGRWSSPRLNRCTISGNVSELGRGAIFIDSHAAPLVTSCIVWDNAGGSIRGDGAPGAVIDHSLIEGDSPLPGEGNIASDPLFCGWGERREVWVDPSRPEPGDGSEGSPFDDVRKALAGFSLNLSAASPCLGTGAGGENRGAYPQSCVDAGPSRTIHLAAGTYRAEDMDLVHRVSLVGSGAGATVIEGTVKTLRTGALLSDVTVTKSTSSGILVLPGESPTIARATIAGNSSGWSDGGGVHSSGSPTFDSCVISGNDARFGGGGVFIEEGSPRFVNCAIAGNGAFVGGGVYCAWPSDSLFRNCTIAGNAAWAEGGGIYLSRSDLSTFTLVNSIVWGNRAAGTPDSIAFDPAAPPAIDHSCLQGPTLPFGEGNTNRDPRFVMGVWEECADGSGEGCMPMEWNESSEPVAWSRWISDLHLGPDSQVRDMGDPVEAPPVDIEGNPRPCLGGVDLGAYEDCITGPTSFRRGDANADGKTDISDPLAVLGFLFLGDPTALPCEKSADFDDGGVLDIADPIGLLGFLFLGGTPPEAPYPACGPDDTPDGLPCGAFEACAGAR